MQLFNVVLLLLPFYRWLCIGLFIFGFVRILARWLKPHKRLSEFEASWLIDVPFRTKFVAFAKTLVSDWTFGATIRRRNIFRWIKHGLILSGFLGLTLFHGLPRLVGLDEKILFPWATLEMREIAHNTLLLLLAAGTLMALANRLSSKEAREVTNFHNYFPIFLLAAIAVSGYFSFTFEYLFDRRGWFFVLHSLIIFGMIAAIPYSKFVHMVAAPIVMLRAAIEENWKNHYVQEVTGVKTK